MKNIITALKLSSLTFFILTAFLACDKDFSVIESDVLGEGNANFLINKDSIAITAYNKKLSALQVNNLASHLLGVFKDEEYGTTTASIITQLTPAAYNVDFGDNTAIDSVIINIPYYSTAISTDTDGNTEYQLDSVYGNSIAPFKLTIYKSNYLLNDTDLFGDANTAQNYYSNASSTVNSALNGRTSINFDNHITETILSKNVIPTPNATVLLTIDEDSDEKVETRSEPSFREVLDSNFWKSTIVDKSEDAELSNENQFQNYFRGLYFKAEAIGSDGNMFLLNLESTNAYITIYYTAESTSTTITTSTTTEGDVASTTTTEDDDGFPTTTTVTIETTTDDDGVSTTTTTTTISKTSQYQSSYSLRFTGNKLNTFINNFDNPLAEGDSDDGDATLYLKGMEGSMAVVDLFGPDTDGDLEPDNLEPFLKAYRKTDDNGNYILDEDDNYILKRLINEAHLEIYEDDTQTNKELDKNEEEYHTYDRIYAYDIKNNTTIIDYLYDSTESTTAAVYSKFLSLGLRNVITENNQEKIKYKIRLTEHLNNIIQNDSTNYNIGLVLSNNVNYTNSSEILDSSDEVTAVPSASIITPRGTILHGSHESVADDKKLKLKIFFTETKEN